MGGESPCDPGGRSPRPWKIDIQLDKDIEIVIVAAEGARLYDVEIADFPQGEDVLCGDASAFFRGVRPRLDLRTYVGNPHLKFSKIGAFPERLIGDSFESLRGNVHVGSSVVHDSRRPQPPG